MRCWWRIRGGRSSAIWEVKPTRRIGWADDRYAAGARLDILKHRDLYAVCATSRLLSST